MTACSPEEVVSRVARWSRLCAEKSADHGTKLLRLVLLHSHTLPGSTPPSAGERQCGCLLNRANPSERAERGLPPSSAARLNLGLACSAGYGSDFGVARIRKAALAPSLIAVSAIGRWR